MKKYILLGLLILLVVIQFIKADQSNTTNDNTHHVTTKYPMSPEVEQIMKNACYDCHSNYTTYPNYFNYQPVGWFLAGHVKNGKKHLNLSEFTNRRIAVQNHKLEEIIEMTESKDMPMASYTFFGLHSEAKLSDAQRKVIIDWAKAAMDTIKNHYPADSLKLERK